MFYTGTAFPAGQEGEAESEGFALQALWCSVYPWVRKMPWRRAWYPTPVFLPREYPQTEEPGGLQSTGCKESDMIK